MPNLGEILGALSGAGMAGVGQGIHEGTDIQNKVKQSVDMFKALDPLQKQSLIDYHTKIGDIDTANKMKVLAQTPRNPVRVKPGESLIDPLSGRTVYQSPSAQEGPSDLSRILGTAGKEYTRLSRPAPPGTAPLQEGELGYSTSEDVLGGNLKTQAPNFWNLVGKQMDLTPGQRVVPEFSTKGQLIPKVNDVPAEKPQTHETGWQANIIPGQPAQRIQPSTGKVEPWTEVNTKPAPEPKPNPLETRNIPDNVLYAIGKGVMPPITLADGSRLDAAGATQIIEEKMRVQSAQGIGRAEAYQGAKVTPVIDVEEGNRPKYVSGREAVGSGGRYAPPGPTVKALNQSTLLEDIRGAISVTRQSLRNMKTEFTAPQAAQLSIALNSPNAPGALDAMFASSIGKTLTPEQIDYVTNLAQLKENAMAMRSVLGAGQGSDELRAAITATLPSPRTPTRAYAEASLNKFEQQLNRLGRGIPSVTLKPEGTVGDQSSGKHRLSGTKTNKPDGNYPLKDGTTITVKGGVVQ